MVGFHSLLAIEGQLKDLLATDPVQMHLQATIDKLKSELEIAINSVQKYRIQWKNECRSSEAERWGGGFSQTSGTSSSPYRVYCEL